MPSNDIYIFVPPSLDGAGAYLAIKWFLEPKNINIKLIPSTKDTIISDLNTLSLAVFKKIYVVGAMFFENSEEIKDIETEFTLFKLEKENNIAGSFKVISLDCKNYTELLYTAFKTKMQVDLQENKKKLLTYIQDYLTYELKHDTFSIGLNYIFSNFNNYQQNRLEKFCTKYADGFHDFNDEDKKIISYYNDKLEHALKGDTYIGELKISGVKVRVVSIFGEKCINEIASSILKSTNSDIAIVVNPTQQTVTFRRNSKCNVNLKNLCKHLCNGDGREYAATGKITEKFLEFSKVLQKQ
jgi:hypothetical protein